MCFGTCWHSHRPFLIFRVHCGYCETVIRYEQAPDIRRRVSDIIDTLRMTHVNRDDVTCIRSTGSKSSSIIARCHGLSRIMQLALNRLPHYVIEVVAERFDTLSRDEQTKVLIHELMHIPHAFGGGFRAHRPYVTRRTVEAMFRHYLKAKVHTHNTE